MFISYITMLILLMFLIVGCELVDIVFSNEPSWIHVVSGGEMGSNFQFASPLPHLRPRAMHYPVPMHFQGSNLKTCMRVSVAKDQGILKQGCTFIKIKYVLLFQGVHE